MTAGGAITDGTANTMMVGEKRIPSKRYLQPLGDQDWGVTDGWDPDVVRITGLVEKPAKEVAPSNYAVIGRYVLKPEVFGVLERTKPGKGGEIQLTDALMEMAGDVEGTGGVYGVVFRGRRYDTGDKLDYIKAVVQLAVDRDDLGPELRTWLAEFSAGLERG